MTLTSDHPVCKAGIHCRTCRDPAATSFRLSTFKLETFDCPGGKPWGWDEPITIGPAGFAFDFWDTLHRQKNPTPAWLDEQVAKLIDNRKGQWSTLVTTLPPDFTSPDAFFVRSIEQHNHVSSTISPPKPKITIEDARKRYNRPEPVAPKPKPMTPEEWDASPQWVRNRRPRPAGPQRLKLWSGDLPASLGLPYARRSAFLICNGPSFAALDHAPLGRPGVLTMGMNNGPATFRPRLWIAGDGPERFLNWVWSDPNIFKFTKRVHRGGRLFDSAKWDWTDRTVNDSPNVYAFDTSEFNADTFLDSDRAQWESGSSRSTMLLAIRVLADLGVSRIFLLGADFEMVEGAENYHFPQDRAPGVVRNNNGLFRWLQTCLTDIRPVLKKRGIDVFNCNPASKLTAFDHLPYAEALDAVSREFGADVGREATFGMYDREKPAQSPAVKVPLVNVAGKVYPMEPRDADPGKWPAVWSSAGKFGDFLYGLATVRALGGGEIRFYPYKHGRGMPSWDGYNELLRSHLAPLLETQPYVTGTGLSPYPVGYDMDRGRAERNPLRRSPTLLARIAWPFGLPETVGDTQWIVPPEPNRVAKVVINRSARYHNDDFPWWRVVKKYGADAVFVGLPEEHRDFCERFGDVAYYPTENYLELAKVIRGSEWFFGNQSSPFALAEGMKVNAVQETCRHVPDCCFARPNVIHGWTNAVELPDLN